MLNFAATGHTAPLDRIRAREFRRLDELDLAYADYTGAALYAESQIDAHHQLLRRAVFGNPHAEHAPSRFSTELIEESRQRLLAFFGVDDSTHDVCFTANTSAAIKLVAESYPFDAATPLVLTADNHNSVNGVREYARSAGAAVHVIGLNEALQLEDPEGTLTEAGGGLFAYPAQSNFSGVMHPLALAHRAKELGYDVLLDVAAYASTHPLDLRACPADYVVLSFYKLFGYPTGVGALVARHEALARLRRPWFAGGTITFASVAASAHRLRRGHEGFEDGTPDFLSIAALPAGFDLLEETGMKAIEEHVAELTSSLIDRLTALRHRNGAPLVRIYGPPDMQNRGGTVAFNVLDDHGVPAGYWAVEERARELNVAVRGGCFCNPGASEAAFGIDTAAMLRCASHLGDAFTPRRFATCSGTAVGAVRASFGLASNSRDVQRVAGMVASFA